MSHMRHSVGAIKSRRASRQTLCSIIIIIMSVENLGPFSFSTLDFLSDLGRRISHISGDDRGSVPLSKNLGHDSTF